MSTTTDFAFYSRPQLERLADRSWQAHYPAMDWSITAESREEAIEQLKQEDMRRAESVPNYIVARQAALSKHLTNPIPGVYAIPMSMIEQFMGTRDEQTELNRIADEMDAGLIANPPL
jgi:hypothetical protein